MTPDNAWMFVQKMREDKDFRDNVQTIGDRDDLWRYLKGKGFAFDECDLVKAMAACMAELDATG